MIVIELGYSNNNKNFFTFDNYVLAHTTAYVFDIPINGFLYMKLEFKSLEQLYKDLLLVDCLVVLYMFYYL